MTSMQQQTLRGAIEFAGVGLHTGTTARVCVRPQIADSGITFRLGDGKTIVPALAEYVVDTRRATVLGMGDQSVSTVEHLLAALVANGVDNALVEVDGTELPILDGSSQAYVEGIAAVGLVAQNAPARTFTVDAPVRFVDGEAMIVLLPAEEFRIRFIADFAAPIGTHYLETVVDAETFASEIAFSRTFCYLHEVEALQRAGLAQGGTLENALVFGPNGPLAPLRRPDEVVRHKILDLIGDFALLGARPRCEIIAIKSGHRMHALATSALRAGAVAPLAAALR